MIERFGKSSLDCNQLRASDIHRFILDCRPGKSAKLRVTVLRSFLRYLQQRGFIATDLCRSGTGRCVYWKQSTYQRAFHPLKWSFF